MMLLSHAFSEAPERPQEAFSDGEPLTFTNASRSTHQRRARAPETQCKADATSARNVPAWSGQEQKRKFLMVQ